MATPLDFSKSWFYPSCVAQCSAHSLSSPSADFELCVLLMSEMGQTQDEVRDPQATS